MARHILLSILFFLGPYASAYTLASNPAQPARTAADGMIPGDNVLRFYRMAIPVTYTAYERNFGYEYEKALQFWQETETYLNRIFVPLGFCFDVIEDKRLVMTERNLIDENVFNAPGFGTELLNEAIGASSYDIGMWVTYREDYEENSGLSVENGAYMPSTKASGYAKTDKWVVAHEVGHLLGANHTPGGEGSLMDNTGDFLSYPSIKRIRTACMQRNAAYYSDEARTVLLGTDNGGNYVYGIKVENTAPEFVQEKMSSTYSIPQGSCLALTIHATDAEKNSMEYMAFGCNPEKAEYVTEGEEPPLFASKAPQAENIIEYKTQYSADIFYDDFFYPVYGTEISSLTPGEYSISILVRDIPDKKEWTPSTLKDTPFYCNYSVWGATIRILPGTEFNASLTPEKKEYNAGEKVTVKWGVNNAFFTPESKVRITMSSDYGKTFGYVLAEEVPAQNGEASIRMPNVNVGNVDVDFITATRQMRGGIIRIEEKNGSAFTLTGQSPDNGGGFTIVGADETGITSVPPIPARTQDMHDMQGRKVLNPYTLSPGLYIANGKTVIVR
ncbi:MAG: hypothetical protein IIV13_01555 [Bacteroidaceae bacterium]|nr:hypothetical protein [Bacteroidaceae bacterium]